MTDEKQTAAIVQVKEEFRLTSWRSEYEEMRRSGMTVKEWCAKRGISQSGFYHRLRRIREYMCGRYIPSDCGAEEQPSYKSKALRMHGSSAEKVYGSRKPIMPYKDK